jgi:predicted regulator of Ras-like GTPase activity (Roadblock/LC7/MglB family)
LFDPKEFEVILTKVIRADSGIKKAILVDRTGLTISHVSRFTYYASDADSIGVIASAVFCASEEQGSSLHIGGLDIVTSEFGSGVIFATSTGRGVLCVITDRGINLGIIRLVMRKAASDLAQKLDLFLASQGASSSSSIMAPSVETLSASADSLGGVHSTESLQQDELEAALKELEKF